MPDILLNYHTWLHGLPPVVQPVVGTFVPSLPVWLAIAIFERHWIAAHGPHRTSKAWNWVSALLGGALFIFRDRYPVLQSIIDWPDNHIHGWRLHWWQMLIGVFAGGFVAKWMATAFAAVFLRGSGSRGDSGLGVGVRVGRHTALPELPPGYGWFSSPEKRQRIIRTRTYEEE